MFSLGREKQIQRRVADEKRGKTSNYKGEQQTTARAFALIEFAIMKEDKPDESSATAFIFPFLDCRSSQ